MSATSASSTSVVTMPARTGPAGAVSDSTRPVLVETDNTWEIELRAELREIQRERLAELHKQAEEEFNRLRARAPEDRAHLERVHDGYVRSLARIRQMMKDEENAAVEREEQVRGWSIVGEVKSDDSEVPEQLKREQQALWDQLQRERHSEDKTRDRQVHHQEQTQSTTENPSQRTIPAGDFIRTRTAAASSSVSISKSIRPTSNPSDEEWEIEFRTELRARQKHRMLEFEMQAEEDFNTQRARDPDDKEALERIHNDSMLVLTEIERVMEEEENTMVERERQIRQLSTKMSERVRSRLSLLQLAPQTSGLSPVAPSPEDQANDLQTYSLERTPSSTETVTTDMRQANQTPRSSLRTTGGMFTSVSHPHTPAVSPTSRVPAVELNRKPSRSVRFASEVSDHGVEDSNLLNPSPTSESINPSSSSSSENVRIFDDGSTPNGTRVRKSETRLNKGKDTRRAEEEEAKREEDGSSNQRLELQGRMSGFSRASESVTTEVRVRPGKERADDEETQEKLLLQEQAALRYYKRQHEIARNNDTSASSSSYMPVSMRASTSASAAA